MEQVIRKTSDEKPCLIGCEPMATCFVPAEGVLSFFDPVFNLSTAIVNRNYSLRFEMRVGHNKSNAGEEFTHMPFDFTDNPSGFIPFLSLVMKLYHPYLYAAFWRTT